MLFDRSSAFWISLLFPEWTSTKTSTTDGDCPDQLTVGGGSSSFLWLTAALTDLQLTISQTLFLQECETRLLLPAPPLSFLSLRFINNRQIFFSSFVSLFRLESIVNFAWTLSDHVSGLCTWRLSKENLFLYFISQTHLNPTKQIVMTQMFVSLYSSWSWVSGKEASVHCLVVEMTSELLLLVSDALLHVSLC